MEHEEAAAEARALLGIREQTPSEDEEWQRIHRAHQTGQTCAGCGRTLEPAEAVYACVFSRRSLFGRSSTVAPVCERCRAEPLWPEFPHGPRRYTLAGGSARWALGGSWPCQGCGRTVHADSSARARFCSERCRLDARNRRRRVARAERTCATCGASFSGSRSDAAYCSGACRQKAYRQRGGA